MSKGKGRRDDMQKAQAGSSRWKGAQRVERPEGFKMGSLDCVQTGVSRALFWPFALAAKRLWPLSGFGR